MAFNQDLGWCVDDAVSLVDARVDAFSGTPPCQCESTPPAASPAPQRSSPYP